MRRPTSTAGLAWLWARRRRRWIAAVVLAMVAGAGLGWTLRPESAPRSAARPAAPRGEGAIEAVVLVDRPPLRAGQIVRVLARSAEPSVVVDGARYPELLVGRDWIAGDALALRARPDDPAGGATIAYEGRDLDGDGAPDRLWHAVRESVEVESERERRDGWLVFDGSRGAGVVPLASSDGWGSAARFVTAQLRDLAGTPAPDLLAILDTDTCEVGPTGHVLAVITFGSGAPELAIEHEVNDPALIGLVQYEVGSVRVRGTEIVARTVVHDPMCEGEDAGCVHVRVERWRHGERASWDEPLRTTGGAIVTRVGGGPLGPDEPPPRFRVEDARGARWVDEVELAEAPYARALREWGTDALDWHDWVDVDWP